MKSDIEIKQSKSYINILKKCIHNKEFFRLTVITALIYVFTSIITLYVYNTQENQPYFIFAAEGIAIGIILQYRKKAIPGFLLGKLIFYSYTETKFLLSIEYIIIELLEIAIILYGIKKYKINFYIEELKDLVGLFVIIIISQGISTLLQTLVTLGNNDIYNTQDMVAYWEQLYFGNTLGLMLLTPLTVMFLNKRKRIKKKELILITITTAIISTFIYTTSFLSSLPLLLSITVPLAIFISIRAGVRKGILAVNVESLIAILLTYHGYGIFIDDFNNIKYLDLRFYIYFNLLTTLFIGILFEERRKNEEKLKKIAHYDNLTGLLNRNILSDKLKELEYNYLFHRKTNNVICFIDLDGFKNINDTLGHDAGDELLKIVSKRFKKLIREEDIVIRLGGDEFLIIIYNIKNKEKIDLILNRMIKEINEPIDLKIKKVRISGSIGVTIYPESTKDIEKVLIHADEAMYIAKKAGKNQYRYY